MHLQEFKLLDLGVMVTQNVAQYHPHHVAYAPAKFEVAMSNGLGGYLQENTLYTDLDLWFKVTQNVAQYPLHHTPYAPTKFEVATSNSLGRDKGPQGVGSGFVSLSNIPNYASLTLTSF